MRLRPTVASSPSAFGYAQDPWSLVLFVAVSVALHLSLVLTAVILPKFRPSRRLSLPAAISVRMVSLPGPSTQATTVETPSAAKQKQPEKKAEAIKPPPPKPEPQKAVPVEKPKIEVPKPEPEKVISISTEKPKKKTYKPKTSLKKKTYQPKTSVKKTMDRLEKKVKNSDSQQVKKALDKIRKQVGKTGPVDQLKQKMGRQGVGSGGTSGFGGGRRAIEMMDIYRAEIPYRIQENWAFSSQLAGATGNIEAVLVVKIMPDGNIVDIWFEKRSGNRYLDESAFKAVQKSSPLPPLPLGYRRPFYNLGLIFTPEGVK